MPIAVTTPSRASDAANHPVGGRGTSAGAESATMRTATSSYQPWSRLARWIAVRGTRYATTETTRKSSTDARSAIDGSTGATATSTTIAATQPTTTITR